MNRYSLKESTLGELASPEKRSIISGPFGSSIGKRFFKDEGVPVIRGNNLSLGISKFKDEGFVFVTEEKADELKSYAVEQDLIFTAVGTIGQVGIIEKGARFEKYVISNKQLRVRFAQDLINPLYAYYWFSSPWIRDLVAKRNVGSTVPLINLTVLKKLPILLPTIRKAQDDIVEILENITSKISLNNRINAELEAMAKTIYDYWFVQFEFPSEALAKDGVPRPYKSSGGEMVWNEKLKREVPKGWENCSLSDIGNVIGGSTPSKAKNEYFTSGGNGISWITPKDLSVRKGKRFISYGEFDVTEAGRKSASLKIMPKGTVLLSSRAPVGYMAIARNPVTTNQGFKSLVPMQGFSTEYVFLTLELYLPAIIKKASGSTFAEISGSTLKAIDIASPPQELIEKFTTTVAPMFAQQEVLEQENQELASLRDWLLPMLMNGQVTCAKASVTKGTEKPSRSLSSADKDLEGLGREKEYVQEGEMGMAAEERLSFHRKQ